MPGNNRIRRLPDPPFFILHPVCRRLVIRARVGSIAAMKKNAVVVIDPEIMSGTPCFAGTRVPVRALLDYIEGGDSLDVFLEDFPTVSREQAIALLEEASELLIAQA